MGAQGGCIEGVGRLYGCLKDVGRLSEECEEAVWRM